MVQLTAIFLLNLTVKLKPSKGLLFHSIEWILPFQAGDV